MLNLIKVNEICPTIGRSAGRAVVGSINFQLVNAAIRHIKREMFGVPVDGTPDIDAFNTNQSAIDDETESAQARVEQGFTIPEDPLVLASLLKIIANNIADNLEDNAGRVRSLSTNKMLPNPYDIAPTVEQSFEQQLKLQPTISKAVIKAEAAELGVSEEEILSAQTKRQDAQTRFLKENKALILETVRNLHWKGDENMDADLAFDRLPAMTRVRLASKADAGLLRAREREIVSYVQFGREDAKGNIKLIDGTRNELLDEVHNWMQIPNFKREYNDVLERSNQAPVFGKRPVAAQAAA